MGSVGSGVFWNLTHTSHIAQPLNARKIRNHFDSRKDDSDKNV